MLASVLDQKMHRDLAAHGEGRLACVAQALERCERADELDGRPQAASLLAPLRLGPLGAQRDREWSIPGGHVASPNFDEVLVRPMLLDLRKRSRRRAVVVD